MDEATHRLQQGPNQAQLRVMRAGVMVLAQRSAIKAVKQQFRAKGLKLQRMAHREVVAAANHYLTQHRAALINYAKEIVDRWHAEGVFGKRGGIRNPVRQRSNIHSENQQAIPRSAGHPITNDFGSQNGACHDQAGSALRPRQH
jgi:hypothetical protein